jgi:hypothetical protein
MRGIDVYIIRKVPETVLFIAAASAGAGAILGAFYTARGLELTASALLTSQETNVIHFLNFLEEVAIAMEKAGADPDILREAFRGIVLTAWSKLQAWAIEQRRKRNAPRLWTNVEDLAKKWN